MPISQARVIRMQVYQKKIENFHYYLTNKQSILINYSFKSMHDSWSCDSYSTRIRSESNCIRIEFSKIKIFQRIF
jgi:hypothetical protein